MNLSYEDCVELKEAGFPIRQMPEGFDDEKENVYGIDGFYFFVPTLVELIDECGVAFQCLVRRTPHEDTTQTLGWVAYAFSDRAEDKTECYSTQEQAVAALFISLQP